MFAARQSLNLFQKRAFSASASQVGDDQLQSFYCYIYIYIYINWASILTYFVLQASKVTVLGAGGGIGQPLSLLLKLNPHVSELSLYDIKGGPGKFRDYPSLGRAAMREVVTDNNFFPSSI